ncbi:hypothetical protein ACLB90_18800 [Stenotrophomonas sp. LGBM10]|uniref:hypothetical protein n=1 Tax=Stenotrophomonas sp. LGBM10 TaxID=3390038 RepID=UPI00398A6343
MRAGALLLVLACATGAAHAAPATEAQVGHVVRALHLDAVGASLTDVMIDNVPALKALAPSDRECAKGPVRDHLDAEFRRQLVLGLGEDGAAIMAEWEAFLPTPAGRGVIDAFANATPDTLASHAAANLDPAGRQALDAFLAGPAFERFLSAFDADTPTPKDLGVRLARNLQDQCRIALSPDDIS